MLKRTAPATLAALALLFASGCGTDSDGSAAGDGVASRTLEHQSINPAEDPSRIAHALGGHGDYAPVASPADLADASTLVVRGIVTGYEPRGVLNIPESPVGLKHIVMKVDVTEVLQGQLPADTPGRVLVQLRSATGADVLDSLTPENTETLLYLDLALPVETIFPGGTFAEDVEYSEKGKTIFNSTNPQGLMLADPADDAVILPEDDAELPATSLDEVEPNNDEAFPEERPSQDQDQPGQALGG